MVLRVAARLRRGSRVGSYVVRQARTPTTRAQRQSCNAQSRCPYAEAGGTTGQTTAHSNWADRRLIRRRKRRETERRRARKRRIELTLHESVCLSIIRIASARSILFSGRGRRGTDWTTAIGRPWRTAAGRRTETHDRRAHHHESSSHRSCWFFFTRQCTCFLRHWSW